MLKASKAAKIKKVPVSKLFARTLAATAATVVNVGGARSGKSYAMAQILIMKALNEPGCNIAITRKTMPALKMTAQRLVSELLQKYGLRARLNKTDNYYALGGSRIQFFSLDDAEKIKSSEFNYIWMEEANEFGYNDYLVLLTRLSAPRAHGGKNRIFLTLNPVDANCWVAKNLLARADVSLINSTYKDNKFLTDEYVQTLLSLQNHDANAYNIYALGLWGSNERMIYPNWRPVDAPPSAADEVIWGLDFGFNNPSALVKVYIKDGRPTAEQMIYGPGMTTADLIARLQFIIPREDRAQPIYADAAEPDRITEIARAGFNIHPALKAVNAGILAVKAAGISIVKGSVDLIKEIQSYAWKADLNGNALEEPVKFNDHALDALRYAVYTHGTTRAARAEPDVNFI